MGGHARGTHLPRSATLTLSKEHQCDLLPNMTLYNKELAMLIPKTKHERIQETHVSFYNMALAMSQEESSQLAQRELAAANTKEMILSKAEYSEQKKLKTNLGEVSV